MSGERSKEDAPELTPEELEEQAAELLPDRDYHAMAKPHDSKPHD